MLAVCRAGLTLAATGALAVAGGTPWAGILLGGGLALLAHGGLLAQRKGGRP